MKVPNHAHFAYTSTRMNGGFEFGRTHYIALKSAITTGNFEKVTLHALEEPIGSWWRMAAEFATLRIVSNPSQRFNATFQHPSHIADAIRLETLLHEGGVFFDLDVIILKSFEPLLLLGKAVIGEEDELALCPAVIASPPENSFIDAWIDGYNPALSDWHGFRSLGKDEFWGEMSTRYPKHLAKKHSGDVVVLPPEAFYPVHWRRASAERFHRKASDDGLARHELESSFTIHLWAAGLWSEDYEAAERSAQASSGTLIGEVLEEILLEPINYRLIRPTNTK